MMLDLARGRPVVRDLQYMRACDLARSRGEPEPAKPDSFEYVLPTIAEKQKAIVFLAEYAFSKPTVSVDVTSGQAPLDMTRLTPEQQADFDNFLAIIAGEPDAIVTGTTLPLGARPIDVESEDDPD